MYIKIDPNPHPVDCPRPILYNVSLVFFCPYTFNDVYVQKLNVLPTKTDRFLDFSLFLITILNESSTIPLWANLLLHLSISNSSQLSSSIVIFLSFLSVEQELLDFIKEILPNEEIIENDREQIKPKEIDVYIPSKKIGFEMNGIEWHSEKYKEDKNYHLDKLKKCLDKGIRLIQIFDDEWNNKKVICKSRIKNILGITTTHIYARKCYIKEVESKLANKFLNENHIQGATQSQYKIGLFYNNELVSLMTFGEKRINLGNKKQDNKTFELIRFCNKLDTTIIGGASKLLKYFIDTYKPKEIISYADRRWSNGNLYEKLGFKCYGETVPNYFYIVNRQRKNRFNYRKNVLVEKYGCPQNMTEREFCKSKGWHRIYDCGCLCYKKTC